MGTATVKNLRLCTKDTKKREELEKLSKLKICGNTSSTAKLRLVPHICATKMQLIASLSKKIWELSSLLIFVLKSWSTLTIKILQFVIWLRLLCQGILIQKQANSISILCTKLL